MYCQIQMTQFSLQPAADQTIFGLSYAYFTKKYSLCQIKIKEKYQDVRKLWNKNR